MKVVPRSRRTEWAGEMADGCTKIRVAAVPEDGQANDELCRFLAAHYGVPRHRVTITAGVASTRKTIRVEGL